MSKTERIIDAHQHFWQLSRGDYRWLTPDLKPLYKDFFPNDLKPILDALEIDGTILVQAAPTVEETKFLLALASQSDFVLGVVGWVDIEARSAPDIFDELAENKYFRGVRLMLHDIAEDDWVLKKKLTPSFEILTELALTLDVLVRPLHLQNVMRFIDRHPDLSIVIDHAAKPAINRGTFEPWADDIERIAQNSKAYCKLSGLLTEAGENGTPEALAPYMDHVLACFGPKRVMWGSDWPVVTLVSSYQQWFELSYDYMSYHFPEFVTDIFGGTAANFYRVSIHKS